MEFYIEYPDGYRKIVNGIINTERGEIHYIKSHCNSSAQRGRIFYFTNNVSAMQRIERLAKNDKNLSFHDVTDRIIK